jgi:hypothetical protein
MNARELANPRRARGWRTAGARWDQARVPVHLAAPRLHPNGLPADRTRVGARTD